MSGNSLLRIFRIKKKENDENMSDKGEKKIVLFRISGNVYCKFRVLCIYVLFLG